MTQAAAPRSTDTTTPAQDAPVVDQDLTEDLIDEVSIDGMCGVY